MFVARNLFFAGSIPPPVYSSVSPSTGASGTTVTVTGQNFVPGNTTVRFNSTNAGNVSVTSATSLTCTVPNLGSSNTTATITIITPSGSVTSGTAFTYYAAPTISSFNPGTREANTSGNVTVYGSNFVSGSTTVTVNGSSRSVTVNGASQLTVAFPSLGRGTYTVTVSTPGGSASANYIYIVTPSLSSISPSSQFVNVNTTYTLTGSGFISGVSSVQSDGFVIGSSVQSGTSMTFTTNYTTTGTKGIRVFTDAHSNQLSLSINAYPAPSISSTTGSRGGRGVLNGSTVTLAGSNFSPGGASTTTVSIGGTTVSASVTNTSISFTVPNLSTDGSKTITVTTAGGSASSSIQFWGAKSATTTTYTSGSGNFSIPDWANSIDIICLGGGQGGGPGTIGVTGRGGAAGVWSSTTLARGSGIAWDTTTIGYAVGVGGAKGAAGTWNNPGNNGGTSSASSYVTAAGGSGDTGALNGASPGNHVRSGITYTGGGTTTGPSTSTGSAPGGGGPGGAIFNGLGGDGAGGQVWFRVYQ